MLGLVLDERWFGPRPTGRLSKTNEDGCPGPLEEVFPANTFDFAAILSIFERNNIYVRICHELRIISMV